MLPGGDTLAVIDPTLTRFKPDGALDSAFDANVPDTLLRLVNVSYQSDGRPILAGTFRSIGAHAYSGLARLHLDGVPDVSFRPGELQREWIPSQIAAQTDGKIIVGGNFTRVDGVPREQLAVLERGGSLSPRTYPSDVVTSAFFLQPDDKLLRWSYRKPDSVFTLSASTQTAPSTVASTPTRGRSSSRSRSCSRIEAIP